MKNILVLGNGRSAQYLIHYLLKEQKNQKWSVRVADGNRPSNAPTSSPDFQFLQLDVQDTEKLSQLVEWSSIVLSLLPPSFHLKVAVICLEKKKHLLTASYTSPEIQALNKQAFDNKCMIAMELGLDPGIDHITAIRKVQEIHQNGGVISSFESYCGGLVAVEDEDNPWKYKVSWNPKNVVMAGQSGFAKYLYEGEQHFLSPLSLFKYPKLLEVGSEGMQYEMYPNRDSLPYIQEYGLPQVKTFIRGTLRRPPFCKSWQKLVEMGYTNQELNIDNQDHSLTWLGLFNLLSPPWSQIHFDKEVKQCLEFLGLFSEEAIPMSQFTPALALESRLLQKLRFGPHQKDRVVLYHRIQYEKEGKNYITEMVMDECGDPQFSAMAKWVGIPLCASLRLMVEEGFELHGVVNSCHPEMVNRLYPVLLEMGLSMKEKESEVG